MSAPRPRDEQIAELVESGLYLVPDYMRDGVRGYFYHGYEPGSFLMALLSNDLMDTLGRADDINIRVLPEWVRFLYNHTPSGSYGSPACVKAWLESFAKAEAA